MMAVQGGAIAIISAESAFLSNTAGGRYTANGEPNLEVILNGHAGDAITVDRKGRSSESIARACLTLCCMVQPSVVQDLGRSSSFMARGGSARLLPSIPPDLVGRRRIDVTPVPELTSTAWEARVRGIAERNPELRDGCHIPWSLYLSSAAGDYFRAYREQHESAMGAQGFYADIRDWAGKQPGAVLRIAGLLHLIQHDQPETKPIDLRTIQAAVEIMNYYAEHARIMYRLMHGKSAVDKARVVLNTIIDLGSPTTRREIHRALHNRIAFAKSADLEEPLAMLEEYGHISREPESRKGTAGRPSEAIVLNPLVLDDKTDRMLLHSTFPDDSVGFVSGFSVRENQRVNRVNPSQPRELGDRDKRFWGTQI